MQDRDDEDFRRVENGYFEAMGIPLLRGRLPTSTTMPPAPMCSPSTSRSPAGISPTRIRSASTSASENRSSRSRHCRRRTQSQPANTAAPDDVHPVYSRPVRPDPPGDPNWIGLRYPGGRGTADREIGGSRGSDLGVRNDGAGTLDSVSGARFNALLLGLFSGLALVLGIAGVYGVFSYIVAQQTREIGVRMALGARPGQMLRLILGRGALLAGGGAVLGLAAAFFLTGVLSTQLYGVAPRDPVTFAGSALVLVTVALAACAIPARRAMRVDPLIALRCE